MPLAMAIKVLVEDGGEPLQQPLLQQPLLHEGGDGDGSGGEAAEAAHGQPSLPRRPGGTCSTAGGVSNLVTTAVGAGMVALPRAVSETGILLGMALFALTALLTFASTSIIVRCAWLLGMAGCGGGRAAVGPQVLRSARATHAPGCACQSCMHEWQQLALPPSTPTLLRCMAGHHAGTLRASAQSPTAT